MLFNKSKENNGVFKGVFTAYFILLLHVLLIAGIALLVIFFQGLVSYMHWIFLFGSAAILFFGYLLYRKAKKEGKALRDVLSMPSLNGQTVEVSFMGGLASIKVGRGDVYTALPSASPQPFQLESPETVNIRELSKLAALFENNLITREEYDKAKKIILQDNSISSHLN